MSEGWGGLGDEEGRGVLTAQIHGLLDISSPSPELRPSPVWQRAGNTQAQGLMLWRTKLYHPCKV